MSSPKQSAGPRVVVPEKELQQKTYAWHAHSKKEVLSVLGVDESGLSADRVEKARAKFGKNSFTEEKSDSLFKRTADQLKSPLAFILLAAFLITSLLHEFVDAGVILFALLIAVVLGVLQEGKASRAFKKLSDSQVKMATVIRGGKRHEISAHELVPGDIVSVYSGAQIPADIRLIHTKQLSVSESALTGEWQPVRKASDAVPVGTPFAEQASMAWMGTFVASGTGLGVVIATGDRTAVGKLAGDLRDIEEVETPLQAEMRRVSVVMLYVIVALVIGIFFVGVWQEQSLHDMLLMSIAIAVASVPEGLPAAVTIILAVGMESLLKRGGLVRNLLAAETLGSTTYVLTDKTGTLTEGKMQITSMYVGTTLFSHEGWISEDAVDRCLNVALVPTDAYLDEDADNLARGDAVEVAILNAVIAAGILKSSSTLRNDRIDVLPFETQNRFAAGLVADDDVYTLCVNGAPEVLLARATDTIIGGKKVDLTLDRIQEYTKIIKEESAKGKRLIAVGSKVVDFDDIPDDANEEALSGLTFLGILVLSDPVREGISDTMANIQAAGASVLLITGDNPETAKAIALEAGITDEGVKALTGNELSHMTDEEILKSLQYVSVFARVLPSQKMRIAQILQQRGEIVAMTGDGINDAPALRRANIGVAIGSGTEVAKESSDLVLVNDTFATIYAAIEEGRRIIANLRKIVGYLLSTSLSEVVLVGAAIMVGSPPPILPAQILWANVIEEGLMSVAFAFEKGEKNAMKKKPQDIHEEGILSREMITFIALAVTVLSILTVTLYFYVRSLNLPIETLRSIMFLAISFDSLFMSFAFRSLSTPIWRISLTDNLFFVGSFLLSLSMLMVVMTVPFFQFILSYEPLPWEYISLALIFSVSSLVVIEVFKWLFFEQEEQSS